MRSPIQPWQNEPVAVLVSGGPDSLILTAELIDVCPRVVPIYVRCGFLWEHEEERALCRFLASLESEILEPLQLFDLPMTPILEPHWSITGRAVPDGKSPDDAVYLPGRNLLLLSQAIVWCHLQKIPTIALGLLKDNPFPDSTERFFAGFEETIRIGLGSQIEIVRPYQSLSKIEVLQRGAHLPLHWTWSCLRPQEGSHCGNCNKCAERRRAFKQAGIADASDYASLSVGGG